MDLSQKEKTIRIAIITVGWFMLIALSLVYPLDFKNPFFILFAAAIIVANCFPLNFKVGQITQAFAFEYLAMMILGPIYAAWISVVGIAGQGVRSGHRKPSWYLLNTAIQSISILVAGLVFFGLGGKAILSSREILINPVSFVPVFAGAITHFIVNIGLVYPLIQIRHGEKLNYQALWDLLQWDFLAKMVFAPLAFYIYLGYGDTELKNLIIPVTLLISLWVFIRKSIELSMAKKKLDENLKRIETLHEDLKKAYDERGEELSIAASIQRNVLPSDFLSERVKIGTQFTAAKVLGGDFYEIAQRSDGLIAVVVGDVSGKGVPAALTMMRIMTILRKLCRDRRSNIEILLGLNRELDWERDENNATKQYATCFLALLDPETGLLRYSCAGHVKPFIYRKDNNELHTVDDGGGFPLGMFKDGQFNDDEIQLSPGDKIIMYTDGAMDAVDKEGDRFNIKRLGDVVKEICSSDENNIAEGILKRIMEFRGDTQLADDIAIVSIEYLGGLVDEIREMKAAVGKDISYNTEYN